jgi:hypothetical protein
MGTSKQVRQETGAGCMEVVCEDLDMDRQVELSLAVGALRGAIDDVKGVADKLHRARRCPDMFVLRQGSQIKWLLAELEIKVLELKRAAARALPSR